MTGRKYHDESPVQSKVPGWNCDGKFYSAVSLKLRTVFDSDSNTLRTDHEIASSADSCP
jgi:hypothetical protein